METLSTICCDTIVEQLFESPDHIQILIGESMIRKVERSLKRTIRKEERRKALRFSLKELSIILPAICAETIASQTDVYNYCRGYTLFKESSNEIVDTAKSICNTLVSLLEDQLFFP
jgi:hypothetical protein